ncbi:class I SAM-dependent methyltransferase [Gloeothece verrucosa]|uniref:Methyltransferase type 11 n=1 Tax=Gloeothece verrucosa (strain PCC 7822) TaxID=497965 RepID=E0UEZ4_GLOV7|nr:class I SAM-dependent methyltransferase [Gloeothece verrucosa]ADN14246.1 Methyltransferase type 11 [Gloeothece verrucosa PCC 7822]
MISEQYQVFEKQETVQAWDEDYYHPLAQDYYDKAIENLFKLMDIQPGETILDAGCGPGVHSIRLAKKNIKVLAIDISKTMLREAQKRVLQEDVTHLIKFKEEDLTALSFADASFKSIFSWGVIIHIKEIEKALDELARVTAPGGKLGLYITNKNALDHTIESLARDLLSKHKLAWESLPMGKGIWFDFNNEKLWVWQIDTTALIKYLEQKNFRLTAHIIGEFTEIQRRLKGVPRTLLLKFNNLCYSLKVSPNLASTNLLIFEKTQ